LEALRCVAQLGYDLSRVQASCSRKRHHDLAQRQLFNRGLDLRGECADLGDEHLEHRDQTLDQRALDGLFAQTDETLRRRAETLQELVRRAPAWIAVELQETRELSHRQSCCAARGRIALEEGQRYLAVEVGKERVSTGPELIEQRAQAVGGAHALPDEVIAGAHERLQGAQLVRVGAQRPEAVSVGPQQVGQDVGVTGVALGTRGTIARPTRLEHVGVNRDDGVPRPNEGVDQQSVGPFDGDGQLRGRRDSLELPKQGRQPLRTVLRSQRLDDLA